MPGANARTFVGFGFGAIQAGLFLYEAQQSGAFERLVVAEVVPEVVHDVRGAGGFYTVNVAHSDRVEAARVGPVQIENPNEADDQGRLIAAVAEAEELATAVPSVDFYASPAPGSVHRILAEGLRRKAAAGGPRCVVYAAENHNQAATVLAEQVMGAVPAGERGAVANQVRFVDTVIAKMSGAHDDTPGLVPVVPDSNRAYLVEAFNEILISQIRFEFDEPFVRGISVFQEKEDLEPFEEAKLYGHNAVHALAAYIGAISGAERVSELRAVPGMMEMLRNALVQESGAALMARYAGVDEFFTPRGYEAFADDLLARMVNPYLQDTVERVGRDPARKLAWEDRLIGTIRLCRQMDVSPRRYAFGAAAALSELDESGDCALVLPILWQPSNPDKEEEAEMLSLVQEGQATLARWRATGFYDVEALFS
jgi:mannitol-1-phosphate 5-dehydrogenase